MRPPKITIRNPGDDIEPLRTLAASIWREYYPAIITPEQIDYMLELMYSPDVIRREMAAGVTWELVTVVDAAEIGERSARAGIGADRRSVDAPVGFVSFSVDEPTATVTLHKLYLVPRLHGQGIGRQMLDHVTDAARRAGAGTVRLQVNKRNTRAIRAYERAGFVATDAIVSDIGAGFVMDDYVMTLDLRDAPRDRRRSRRQPLREPKRRRT